jgi:2-dehydropantoate 2-reductase
VRIVVVGAGAIGGYIGARLAQAGADVTLVARGAHYRAMRDRGLIVREGEAEQQVRTAVTDDVAGAGPCDVVVLSVKAHSLTAVAPALSPLLGPDTVVVSTQNGVPWWYFQRHGGELEGRHLDRVDPGGVIARAIEPRRVVGSIVYFSTDVVAPGVIQHVDGHRISLGEPDGSRSDRCQAIAQALSAAGLRCRVTTTVREEIWVKLMGSVAFNPVSALTRATLADLLQHPGAAGLVRDVMAEVRAVAERIGIAIRVSIDQRMAAAAHVGAHKTSMLQDVEAGRPMEHEAVVGAVLELGDELGVPMPATRAVYACVSLLDAVRRRRAEAP